MSDMEEKKLTVDPQPAAQEQPAPEAQPAKGKKEKPKRTVGQEIMSWVWTILAALIIAFAVRSFIGEPVKVDGESMMNTLQDGEVMVVTKFEYSTLYLQWPWGSCKSGTDCTCTRFTLFGNPKRFDVVVCRYPGRGDVNFVKRIIGIPGDTLKLENGYFYIKAAGETEYTRYDEVYVDEEYRTGYLNASLQTAQLYGGSVKYTLNDDGSFTVPEGQYFVVGDHRNNSNDSRMQGPINRDMIVGKVAAVVWPLNKIRSVPNGLDVKN